MVDRFDWWDDGVFVEIMTRQLWRIKELDGILLPLSCFIDLGPEGAD